MSQRPSAPAQAAESAWEKIVSVDQGIIGWLRRNSFSLIRISLAIVLIWFGALKVARVSPVEELVSSVVYWVDPSWFVPVLGVFEILVGVGLLLAKAMRLVLLLFALQMVGTFLVLIIRPDLAFQNGNPLLLTTEGEFVVKNLVLLSAGMAVGARLRTLPSWHANDYE
jgi:putative oxidoreductase